MRDAKCVWCWILMFGMAILCVAMWTVAADSDINPSFEVSEFSVVPSEGGAVVQLTFHTETNYRYSVLSNTCMLSNSWRAVAADLKGKGTSLVFTVTNAPENQVSIFMAQTFRGADGLMVRDVWTNLAGGKLSDLRAHSGFPNAPATRVFLHELASPTGGGPRYGQRLRGMIIPPVSGSYTFWLAACAQAELYLNSNDVATGASLIAQVDEPVAREQWDVFPEQQSAAQVLAGGCPYYIEVLHSFGTNDAQDHVEVAWATEGMSRRLIDGAYMRHKDTFPPVPNPMSFTVLPQSTDQDRISMTASDAVDGSGEGVEYYFACIDGDGPSSGWQDSRTFTTYPVTPTGTYTYIVSARDRSTNRNTTIASDQAVVDFNLLQNGSFEQPELVTLAGTNISASGDWQAEGNNQVIKRAAWAAANGTQGVWLQAWSPNLTGRISQNAAARAGESYVLNAKMKLDANFASNGSQLSMSLIWLDASGEILSSIVRNVDERLESGKWTQVRTSAMAPVGAVSVRTQFDWSTDGVLETLNQVSACIDDVTLYRQYSPADHVESSEWARATGQAALRVGAAQYAGTYAVADHILDTIELRSIDQTLVDTIKRTDIEQLVSGSLVGEEEHITALAFTASGRQLFFAVHGQNDNSVLAYNAGTKQLRSFIGPALLAEQEPTTLAHFKGTLFMGTQNGRIHCYQAKLNTSTGSYMTTVSLPGNDATQTIKGIAVDIQDEMLYVASPSQLYRLNPSNGVLTSIAQISGIQSLSMGRTFGANGKGGLVLLQQENDSSRVYRINTEDLQAGGVVSLIPSFETTNEISNLAATSCGRLLCGGAIPVLISDSDDTHLSFREWVADEFQQNVLFAKTLCWPNGALTGMVYNSGAPVGRSRQVVASPDAAYWVVLQLILSDALNDDPEAQDLVRAILRRYATLEVNSDGHWYHWYSPLTGELSWGGPEYRTSIFSTMKGVHMALRAQQYYSNDTEIVEAANTIIGNLRNQRHYIRSFGGQVSPADNCGPIVWGNVFKPYIETHLFSELTAAAEPMCENSYLDYWRNRSSHTYNYELPNEPVVRRNASSFWRMYDQATIQFCRNDDDWRDEFSNFYALFAGWTDDHAPDHLTAFSAGVTPSGYNADTYLKHPDTVNSFGTVMGFGLHGNTLPIVGAYYAYRDDQRQIMKGSGSYPDATMLTRVSYDNPSWVMTGLSPTDHQYGSYALAEILQPGIIDRTIALDTYSEPQWSAQPDESRIVNFSLAARRHIRATTDGTNWDSFGFQYAPVVFDATSPYTNFVVTGAEGELLSIANHDFEEGLAGWTKTGNAIASQTKSAGIYGNGIMLTVNSDADQTNTLEQSIDVAADLDQTRYLARAIAMTPDDVDGQAYLQVQWHDATGLVSSSQSAAMTGQTNHIDFEMEVFKPSGATEMRLALVTEAGSIAAGQQERYVFDEVSVVLDGAEIPFGNGGFESADLSGWADFGHVAASVVADPTLEGSYALEMRAPAEMSNSYRVAVYHDYDISGDSTNTCYVLEFDVSTENLQGSDVRARIEMNTSSNRAHYIECDTLGRPNTITRLSGGLRKRSNDILQLRAVLYLWRTDRDAVTAEERVLLDNIRLLKMAH